MSSKPTVFAVEDDDALRDALGELLRAEGYDVRCFASAEEFLAAEPDGAAACAILDIHLPGMSGLDLQTVLRDSGATIPVIVLTAAGDVPKAVRALKAGAVDFIEKPFHADALMTAVAEAVASRGGSPVARLADEDFPARVAQLTAREKEVMDLIVAGDPNKVVAAKMRISVRTVENHRAKVMEKMRSPNLSLLIHMILRNTANRH